MSFHHDVAKQPAQGLGSTISDAGAMASGPISAQMNRLSAGKRFAESAGELLEPPVLYRPECGGRNTERVYAQIA